MANFKDIQQLHLEKFGIPYNANVISHEEKLARADFIKEELIELKLALDNNAILDEIDALVDITYVAMGTAALMGINWENHFTAVHNANMKKIAGFNPTRPNMPRDLRKPKGWQAPDHYKELCKNPKIMIIGHARHGKDTVADLLSAEYSLCNGLASLIACEKFIFTSIEYIYESVQDCYNDRHNHREEWFNLIASYNDPDKAALGKLIYNEADIYCGVRDASELWAINKESLYDLCIWIDAMERCEPEDSSSINVTKHMADVVIDNNGPIENLLPQIKDIMKAYGYDNQVA